jgi:hypothetical protein
LAFGQPRQKEFVEQLAKQDFSPAEIAEIHEALVMDLRPQG